MTVVNYSFQDTFGNNKVLLERRRLVQRPARPIDRTGRPVLRRARAQLHLFGDHPADRGAARHSRGIDHAATGRGVAPTLVLMALPLLVPWNVVGTIWQSSRAATSAFSASPSIGLGINYNYTADPIAAWITIIVMDVWHWTSLVALLCYAGLKSIPEAFYQAARIDGASRLGRVPEDPIAQDAARPADRRTVALHG